MHRLKTYRRMLKWAVDLGQFDIDIQPRTAIKTQALTDFLLEFPLVEVITGQEVSNEPVKG